jgi:tetratricopeptide (TPR) repeat protein
MGVAVASALVALLHERHAATGEVADLDRAVAVGFRALSEDRAHADARSGRSSSHRLVLLANLANTFRLRHEAMGRRADLDEAVGLGHAALALQPGQAAQERAVVNNLSLCLRLRAGLDAAPHDVREAIRLGERALELTPPGDPQRVAVLTNLAGAHHVRYELSGDSRCIESAVALSRSALAEAPSADRLRPHLLSNLAASLQLRAEWVGHEQDVEEAVKVARVAVAETAPGDPLLAARLTNLATAYLVRFDHGDVTSDLDEAIGPARRALESTPRNDPARAGRASNLAAALRTRFERTPAPGDLTEALAAAREAVSGSAPGQARVAHLSTLATVLRAAFRHDRPTYGTEAVGVLREAASLCGADSPDRASVLSNLGAVLSELHEHRPAPAVLVEAEAAFREATGVVTARPHVRVSTASSWGRIAAERGDLASAHDGLSIAVEMLGRLAPVDMLQEDQERGLRRHAGVAVDAAACALEMGDPDRALALLELGRGIMMRRLVDTRSDLGLLAVRAPDLALRLEENRRRLDLARWRGPGVRGPGPEDRRAVAADLEETSTGSALCPAIGTLRRRRSRTCCPSQTGGRSWSLTSASYGAMRSS